MADIDTSIDRNELMLETLKKMSEADTAKGTTIVGNMILNKEDGINNITNTVGIQFYSRLGDNALAVGAPHTNALFRCNENGSESVEIKSISDSATGEKADTPEELLALIESWGLDAEDVVHQVQQYTNDTLRTLLENQDFDMNEHSMCNKFHYENQLIVEGAERDLEERNGYTIQDDLPHNKPDRDELTTKR